MTDPTIRDHPPTSDLERRHTRAQLLAISVCHWIALLLVIAAVAAALLATQMLPWFDVARGTIHYPELRADVQYITGLSIVQTAWFRGLCFAGAATATVFVLLAAGRQRRGQTIAYLWVGICFLGVLVLTGADTVHDLRNPSWSSEQLRDQLGQNAILLGVLVICLILWSLARTRSALGPAVVAFVISLAGMITHVLLLVRIWRFGVNVAAGPVAVAIMFALLTTGTVSLVIAAGLEGPRIRRPRRTQTSTRASSGASKLA